MGPMRNKSLNSYEYVCTYLCGSTEFSFVYLLKTKSEQFEKFREFKSYYELLAGKKIKELRTDNGREYLSNEFRDFLKFNGIKHNKSVAYGPQSNGKAERFNRTLVEKSRCMLLTSEANINLWGAAINTANYLRNISPSAVLNGKSPYEVFFKKLPNLKHLKIFGCDAYPLKLNEHGDKFAATAKKNCIMIGYGDKEGIYWILDKETRKIFKSRDVRFNESELLAEKLNESGLLVDTNQILAEENAAVENKEENGEKTEDEKAGDDSEARIDLDPEVNGHESGGRDG